MKSGVVFIAAYVLVAGFATFALKLGLGKIDALQLLLITAIAQLTIAVPAVAVVHRTFAVPRSGLVLSLVVGVLYAAGGLLFLLAASRMGVGLASVLASSYLVLTVVLSLLFLREPMTWQKALGMLLVFIGVGVLTLS